MHVYIKEWPNRTATIMSVTGQVIWTFSSTTEARHACSAWHNLVGNEPVLLCDDSPETMPALQALQEISNTGSC